MTAVLDGPAAPVEDVDPLYSELDPTTLPPIRPAHVWRPPRARSWAPQLAELSQRLGRPLDVEQVEALDVLTGERADGRPSSLMSVILAGRQNVKTWGMQLIALGAALRPESARRIVWSAHEVSTSSATQQDLVELIETHRWLERYVAKVMTANGKESITFTTGCELRFKARIRTGGRGLFGDLVMLDEGFALRDEHMGSLIPIMSTRPLARAVVGSSAPMADSTVLHDLVRRGRAGGVGAPAYIEFRSPGSWADPGCDDGGDCRHEVGTPGCVMDRLDGVAQANIGVRAGRIGVPYLREERRTLSPTEFGRERLGWEEAPADTAAGKITLEAWAARTDAPDDAAGHLGSRVADGQPVVFALDVAPGRKSAAIAVCGLRADGARHVGLVAADRGDSWVVERLLELRSRHRPVAIVLDGASPASALLADLLKAGLEVKTEARQWAELVVTTVGEMGQACGSLERALASPAPDLWHRGDPIFAKALEGAGARDIGDGGWAWARRKSDVDITPLVAITLAQWALTRFGSVGQLVF